MTTPDFEWTCAHCGRRCGGRLATGYRALGGEFSPDGAIHATCSPDDPAAYPECWRRIAEFGETPGALRGVDLLPVGAEDIRVSLPAFIRVMTINSPYERCSKGAAG